MLNSWVPVYNCKLHMTLEAGVLYTRKIAYMSNS